jgi:peptidoglycan lytic transglycosylase
LVVIADEALFVGRMGFVMSHLLFGKSGWNLAILSAAILFSVSGLGHAEVASIYGGPDGLCGHRTANGERLNCAAMTAAHRTLPFGTMVRVCHNGCVMVRINDRGPFVRGRNIDLSPAAARAIGLNRTDHVTISSGL